MVYLVLYTRTLVSCVKDSTIVTGYSVSCGSGTDNSSSSIKQYTLNIHRAAVRDSTDWWCQLNAAPTRSQDFSLAVYSE